MKPVTVINRLVIKPGKMQEFLQVQQAFVGSLTAKPRGLIASRTYRSIDDESVVLMSQFESVDAQESMFRQDAFQHHVEKQRELVESSSPSLYEETSTAGDFR